MALAKMLVLLTYFCFRFLVSLMPSAADKITVCSYNLWNLMFSWEIRLLHAAEMVRQAECDVLALQEVRIHGDRSWSQAQHLLQLLPEFRWEVTRWADKADKLQQTYWTGWEGEGIAVLSKFAIGTVWSEHLSRAHGPDTNQRIALHVPVIISSQLTLNIVAVHFSYHREQQCQNAVEVLNFIIKKKLDHVVIAGDFNTYLDFPDPVQLFLDRAGSNSKNRCQYGLVLPNSITLADTWEAISGPMGGYTFSNMPTPGLVSRPDRILTSTKDIRVLSISLSGNGTAYKAKHWWAVVNHRLQRVLAAAARKASDNEQGYSCLQNCGPRGSCRCGVCVLKETLEPCLLPHCEECSSTLHAQLRVLSLIVLVHLLVAGATLLKILVVASRIDQSGTVHCIGWQCCLFNPKLLRQPTFSGRHKACRVLRQLGFGRIPPLFLLPLSLILMCIWIVVCALWNKATIKTVLSIMPEEYFPSDHLMLISRLNILS